ncbi:MAG: malonyl-CoA synthase [Rhodobacteraceae bacterium]|nr:malonyl-CoA synthase [Paracoccaceae bacterium]
MTNTLHDALFAARAGADAPFLYLPGRDDLSRADFARLSARYATTLGALGLKPGDRLALQVEKSAEALALYAACIAAGVVFLPLNTAYTPAEIGYFLTDAEPALAICDPAAEPALRPLADAAGARLMTLDSAGGGSFPAAAEGAAERFAPVPRGADDLAALLYTSGTTGRSKGAMLTHGNLLSNARALAAEWRFTDADVLLHALPIFHAHGLFVACNVVALTGGAMIFLPKFAPGPVLQALPHATAMMGVPTFYTRLLAEPRFDRAAAAHMRLFVSGSAPLLAETHVAFEARTGHRILERYGMTETGMNSSNPYEGERRAGTVGFPLPGVELRVVNPDTGTPLPDGEIGMIEVKGPNVFAGYWRMPEKTAEEFHADGFFVTGDLGRVDGDGYVHIVGRQKDLVISGGFNVYPKEVELVLDGLPGVLESAVVGVPHPDFGEAVLGLVVPEPGQAPAPETLQQEAARQLANYKRPKRLILLEELPRNTMGKVQKAALRERFAGLFTG